MDHFLVEQIIGPKGPLSGEKVQDIHSISGGCIHDAWKLQLANDQIFFAKTNSPENYKILEFEFNGLKTLNNYADDSLLIIPKPLHVMKLETSSILLMQWIDIQKNDDTNLGKGLALMHSLSSENRQGSFGWGQDGFIGTGPQPGGFTNNWGECFVNLRLIPQMKVANCWGFNLNKYRPLLLKIIDFLNEDHPSQSIVHGDLWAGNAGMSLDNRGVIFDPAVWWGNREVDIAMTKLFGGFSKQFYEGYEQVWKLEESFFKKIDIYNLYHLLNHANLFGGGYKTQCMESLKKIEKLLLL